MNSEGVFEFDRNEELIEKWRKRVAEIFKGRKSSGRRKGKGERVG